MLYCFDKRIPFDYSKKEMEICKKDNKGILYDSEKKEFIDFSFNKININDEIIFPRTGSTQIYDMNNTIIKNGGIPIISSSEIDKIYSWPDYYKAKRRIRTLKGKDLIDISIINEIEEIYGKEIFLKTKEKNFNGIINTDLLKDPECAFYKALTHHLDDEFILSEKVDIINDELGLKEYRCFVINNEIYNISRFTTEVFHRIDESILEKAKEIVKTMNGVFPNCYVVDILEYQKDGKIYIDVSEFNPIHASGLYLYNSVINKSDDILHNDIKNISQEFNHLIDKCSESGTIINLRGNLYEVPGSFSYDLRNICLSGDVGGVVYSDWTNLTVKDFASHGKILDLENLDEFPEESFDLTPPKTEDILENLKGKMSDEEFKELKILLTKK